MTTGPTTIENTHQLPLHMSMYGFAGGASTVCVCSAHSKPHQQAERGDLRGGGDGHGGGPSGQLPRQGPVLLISPWSKGKPCIQSLSYTAFLACSSVLIKCDAVNVMLMAVTLCGKPTEGGQSSCCFTALDTQTCLWYRNTAFQTVHFNQFHKAPHCCLVVWCFYLRSTWHTKLEACICLCCTQWQCSSSCACTMLDVSKFSCDVHQSPGAVNESWHRSITSNPPACLLLSSQTMNSYLLHYALGAGWSAAHITALQKAGPIHNSCCYHHCKIRLQWGRP